MDFVLPLMWGMGDTAAQPQRPDTAGALPPPTTARASAAEDRLRPTPATTGGAGADAGAPITAANATIIKTVLASWRTLRDHAETFHPEQSRGEDVSHHKRQPRAESQSQQSQAEAESGSSWEEGTPLSPP